MIILQTSDFSIYITSKNLQMVYSSQRRHSDECDMEETLTQISLSAARARHAAKNLTYDETATIDVTKHIKIFSVILPLPLGRKLQIMQSVINQKGSSNYNHRRIFSA